ncbi:MAG: heavy metal translocating P-type ATPase [Luteolibacter sp.]|uniref:heavy metal translocating P-type ATPase n=1 Tax=Luteolibacter sp. TaxID=1962973 RepID=UPI003263D8F2
MMKNGAPDGIGHELTDHTGIVRVRPDLVHASLEIDFDPNRLTESDVRELVKEHTDQVAAVLQKSIFRLEGSACEACALKLEKKVEKIPGVRRASATYLGKVLSVTFDSGVSQESAVFDQLRTSGADIRPLETKQQASRLTFGQKIGAGELNEEISCGLGLIFLIVALVVEKTAGIGIATHALYVGAYVFAGQQGVRSAIASLRERVLDVDVLMVLAALGAAIIGAPFEGALLLFLFSFSNVLQRHAMERTQKAIESLLTLRPSEALVKRDGGTEKVPVESLEIGDIVIVRPGEQIPVDGVISEGSTNVDESSLTGESMPVSKALGSTLFAGTLNQSGGIELTVTKRTEDSALSRMVKLVAEAQAEKSNTQRFLEKAEQYYAMGVIGFTFLVFLIPFLSGDSFAHSFYRAMTIMVVASPCALVISTPATVLSAIGGAARRGILIKGGSHLERAAKIDIVAIDKTGTLTVGKPSLTEIVTAGGIHEIGSPLPASAISLLRAAAALEAKSEHPLAHAIVKSAADLNITLPEATDFQSTTGKGAEATIESIRYLVGSERLFRELNASGATSLAEISQPLQAMGKTCVWLGIREGDNVTAQALLVMADTIRPAARQLAEELHRLGVRKVVMLTGDQRFVAEAIAKEAKVDEVHAELLPEDKLNVIRELKKEGTVMMIGDGVNDAPALAISDIGVAMGAAGTDVAMETADIVLMGDRLENIPLLLNHARRAKRVLLQNLIFASAVILVLIISALGFSLPLPLGVVGHEGSTVLVCLNGLRLLLLRQSGGLHV